VHLTLQKTRSGFSLSAQRELHAANAICSDQCMLGPFSVPSRVNLSYPWLASRLSSVIHTFVNEQCRKSQLNKPVLRTSRNWSPSATCEKTATSASPNVRPTSRLLYIARRKSVTSDSGVSKRYTVIPFSQFAWCLLQRKSKT
jgi:hypothetical protein